MKTEKELLALLEKVDSVITELFPGIKGLVIKDFAVLNETLIDLKKTIDDLRVRVK